MKHGFTTGSCAAAAAKAGAYMLLGGNRKERISIDTPAGITYETEILDINIGEEAVSCAVRKYSGDDPDITNDALIYARVERIPDATEQDIIIEGGEGVGIVTRPGLDQPVGNAAINSVPRKMITEEVQNTSRLFDYTGALKITIYVPGGDKLALQTFNPHLGIEGGISIIGTNGIVEPMSTRAILETIRIELNQRRIEGSDSIVISPGNYGFNFMRERYGYDLNDAVKCSNYIGDTIDMAAEAGYKRFLIIGHIGKLIKLSGGMMNTHSSEGDCRMELMAAAAIRAGADNVTLNNILNSISTDEAYEHYVNAGIEKACMSNITDKVMYYLNKRADGRMAVDCIIFSNKWGVLGCSAPEDELIACYKLRDR